jgi:hypothetical protein
MKTSQITLFALLFVAVGCGGPAEEEGSGDSVATLEESEKGEYFEDFFEDFMDNHSFQANRIKWPLTYVGWKITETGMDLDTMQLNKEDWQHEAFYKSMHIRSQMYDNHRRRMNDTDERVFSWMAPSGGIEVNFYFKREAGKWYMTRKEDLSQ